MIDNRLDSINKIEPIYIDRMTELRKKFIELDRELGLMAEEDTVTGASLFRAISLSRTHIEIALQFAIKSLCLMGEIKE